MTADTLRRPRLRIAITADPDVPVPPVQYGGIERVIHFLVDGLAARGHSVTLFAHEDSRVPATLVPYRGRSGGPAMDTARNAFTIARHVVTGRFDVVHSFGRLATLAPLALTPVPKLMSFQRPITPQSIVNATRLFGRSLQFSVCGEHMVGSLARLATWHVIPNGVPLDRYTFVEQVPADAPLVFLGRIERIKGPHTAIEVARRTGRRLLIAGNIAAEHETFFDREIVPHLGDAVEYIGAVDDQQKNALLGSAAALLMPVEWDEPFGIVMAEALACGTPVIGLSRGAVPEVVRHGVTGFVAADVDGIAEGVRCLHTLDRSACRDAAEKRFSDAVIVDAYESVYRRMSVRRHRAPAPGLVRHVTP
jgi:glycosyltransferase involved in cell wall biosynthesis